MGINVSGLNYIMPEKAVFVNCSDACGSTMTLNAWLNDDNKPSQDRNKVNNVRKVCRSRFYASNVNHLKQVKPKEWWR